MFRCTLGNWTGRWCFLLLSNLHKSPARFSRHEGTNVMEIFQQISQRKHLFLASHHITPHYTTRARHKVFGEWAEKRWVFTSSPGVDNTCDAFRALPMYPGARYQTRKRPHRVLQWAGDSLMGVPGLHLYVAGVDSSPPYGIRSTLGRDLYKVANYKFSQQI